MDSNSLQHLERKKQALREQFRETRNQIAYLESELARIKDRLNFTDELIEELRPKPSEGLRDLRTATRADGSEALGVTAAVEKFFRERPIRAKFTVEQVTEGVSQLNHGSDATDLRNTIGVTLNRLHKSERLFKGVTDAGPVYWRE